MGEMMAEDDLEKWKRLDELLKSAERSLRERPELMYGDWEGDLIAWRKSDMSTWIWRRRGEYWKPIDEHVLGEVRLLRPEEIPDSMPPLPESTESFAWRKH